LNKIQMNGFRWLLLPAPVLIIACRAAFRGVGLPVGHPADPSKPPADLTKSLASHVALAAVIERFWETIFNLLESLALSFGGVAGVFSTRIKKLMAAKAAIISAAPDPSDLATQAHLGDINGALAAALKAPRYVAVKRFITLFGSLILGLVCSITAHLGIFNEAGFPVPAPMDVLLTGVLIGAGAEPVHQVITGLQSARDALAGAAQLAKSAALRNAVQAVSQSTAAPLMPVAQANGAIAAHSVVAGEAQLVRARNLIQ